MIQIYNHMTMAYIGTLKLVHNIVGESKHTHIHTPTRTHAHKYTTHTRTHARHGKNNIYHMEKEDGYVNTVAIQFMNTKIIHNLDLVKFNMQITFTSRWYK